MNILIIGSGGREHALAWKCAQSSRVDTVFVAPGNAGTAREAGVANVAVDADDIDGLIDIARQKDVGLTIVGPEAPLVAGVVDRFNELGLPCFGPSAAAAQLEGSKAFTKDFLARHGIPTAAYRNFTELDAALDYIREQGAPIVIKADGLAAGKGVIVAETVAEAEQAATDMLAGGAFGSAGARNFSMARRRASSSSRTARRYCRWRRRRTTRRGTRATSDRTPAAWAPTRPPRSSRPTSRPASWTRSSGRPSRACARTATITSAFFMPA